MIAAIFKFAVKFAVFFVAFIVISIVLVVLFGFHVYFMLLAVFLGLGLSVLMLRYAFSGSGNDRDNKGSIQRYLSALLSWVPLWFFTHTFVWKLFGGHDYDGYTIWIPLMFLFAFVVSLLAFAKGRGPIYLVSLLAAFGLLFQTLEIDGFGHHMPWYKTSAVTQPDLTVGDVCLEDKNALVNLYKTIADSSSTEDPTSDRDDRRVGELRRRLDANDCEKIASQKFSIGDVKLTPADARGERINIRAVGWKGDFIVYTVLCKDSDGDRYKTFDTPDMNCIYGGTKDGQIEVIGTDAYGIEDTWTEPGPPSPSPTASGQAFTDEDADRIREQLREQGLVDPEFDDEELDVTTSPDRNQVVERGVTTSYIGNGDKELQAPADVGAFLRGSSDRSQAARRHVEAAIREAGYGDAEIATALDGSCYVALQPPVATQIMGTTYFNDGKVLETTGSWRTVGPKDIYWLCIMPDYTIVPDATIRADCANPGLERLRPIRQDTPQAPSVASCGTECQPVPVTTASSTSSPTPTPSPTGKDDPKSPITSGSSSGGPSGVGDERTSGFSPPSTAAPRPTRAPRTTEAPQPQPTLSENPDEVGDGASVHPSPTPYVTGVPCLSCS